MSSNQSFLVEKSGKKILLVFTILVITFIFSDLSLGKGKLDDYFHHGEYFNVLPSILLNFGKQPYMSLHGALDYLPAWLAYELVGDQFYVHLTHIFYISLKLLGCILFLLILNNIYSDLLSLLCCAFIAPFIINYRDFSLLLLIYTYLSAKKSNLEVMRQYFLFILVALTAVFNLFYSTNRGIAGTIAVGSALLIDIFYNKKYIFPILIFIVTALFIDQIIPVFSLDFLLSQLPFLIDNSKRWAYDHNIQTISLSIYIALLLGLTSLLNLKVVYEKKSLEEDLANIIMLSIISIFYFHISTYRADIYHIVMGIIIVIVNLFYFFKLTINDSFSSKEVSFYIILFICCTSIAIIDTRPLIILLPLIILSNVKFINFNRSVLFIKKGAWFFLIFTFIILQLKIYANFTNGKYSWINEPLFLKENHTVLSGEVVWVSQMLKSKNTKCLMDMTNSGVINAILLLPNCTKYSYVAFANSAQQTELINSIDRNDPSAVVTNGEGNYFKLNWVALDESLPILHSYILNKYPNEICQESFCIRFK